MRYWKPRSRGVGEVWTPASSSTEAVRATWAKPGFSADNTLLAIRTHVWPTDGWSRRPRSASTFDAAVLAPLPEERSPLGSGRVHHVAVSADGGRVVTVDSRVAVVRDRSGQEINDGRFMAGGGWDRTIRLWSTDSWHAVRTLRGHRDCVVSVAFSAEDQVLASTGLDGTLRLWDISTGRLR